MGEQALVVFLGWLHARESGLWLQPSGLAGVCCTHAPPVITNQPEPTFGVTISRLLIAWTVILPWYYHLKWDHNDLMNFLRRKQFLVTHLRISNNQDWQFKIIVKIVMGMEKLKRREGVIWENSNNRDCQLKIITKVKEHDGDGKVEKEGGGLGGAADPNRSSHLPQLCLHLLLQVTWQESRRW